VSGCAALPQATASSNTIARVEASSPQGFDLKYIKIRIKSSF
jgi:hypothetical protein